MRTIIQVHGKRVRVELTNAAEAALAKRRNILLAEMELYFSCFIRKRVRFTEATTPSADAGDHDRLRVSFRAVTTKHCRIDEVEGDPPQVAMPIVHLKPFIPSWLRIDYRRGQWRGEFGLDRISA